MAAFAFGSKDGNLFHIEADGGAPDRRPPSVSGGEDRRPAGREAAGVGGSSKLEQEINNRTFPESESRLVFKPHRCKLRTCSLCGCAYGWRVRDGLLARAHLFKVPGLLTLTVDRRGFESPEDAHSCITLPGFIRRLMKFLGVTRWVWTLEFQQKTGTGWPHWHLLVDLSELPATKKALKRAWRLWRDKWNLGGLKLSSPKAIADPRQAINYITKYLTKVPEGGFPPWVLMLERRVRFFAASKAIGPVLSTGEPKSKKPAETDEADAPKRRAKSRPLYERMGECGQRSVVLRERKAAGAEEATYDYIGTLDVRPGRLIWLSRTGDLRSEVVIEKRHSDKGDEWLEPVMPESVKETAKEQYERLKLELHGKGETALTNEAIAERQRAILESNQFAGREDLAEPETGGRP